MKIATIAAVMVAASTAFGELIVKDGDTLAFLGDSITQQGQEKTDGYVNLVLRSLAIEGVYVKPVKAGVSGNKSNDMLARLDSNVLSKKPNVMTLSCGVNDVWHQDWKKGRAARGLQEEHLRDIRQVRRGWLQGSSSYCDHVREARDGEVQAQRDDRPLQRMAP